MSLHGVPVVLPTNDREIPGSTPGKYNLQNKITSKIDFWEFLPGSTSGKRARERYREIDSERARERNRGKEGGRKGGWKRESERGSNREGLRERGRGRERERERGRERERERARARARERARKINWERERESELARVRGRERKKASTWAHAREFTRKDKRETSKIFSNKVKIVPPQNVSYGSHDLKPRTNFRAQETSCHHICIYTSVFFVGFIWGMLNVCHMYILLDWCCFYYFVRNSLVALLEALCAKDTCEFLLGFICVMLNMCYIYILLHTCVVYTYYHIHVLYIHITNYIHV